MSEVLTNLFGNPDNYIIFSFAFCISILAWFLGYSLRLLVTMLHSIKS